MELEGAVLWHFDSSPAEMQAAHILLGAWARQSLHPGDPSSKCTKSSAASRTIHDLLDSRAAERDEEGHCLSDSQGLSFPEGWWSSGIGGQEAQP